MIEITNVTANSWYEGHFWPANPPTSGLQLDVNNDLTKTLMSFPIINCICFTCLLIEVLIVYLGKLTCSHCILYVQYNINILI